MDRTQRDSPLRGLLSLIDAMGGRLESRIRLQKAIYLLKMTGVEDFRGTTFKYHHYGPYSRSLSDILQDAIASGFLQEKRVEYSDEQSKYTYELTQVGKEWLEENVDFADKHVLGLAPLFKDVHWRVMELAATALFVERDEALTVRAEALERAIKLKPACADFRADAERLLGQIGL